MSLLYIKLKLKLASVFDKPRNKKLLVILCVFVCLVALIVPREFAHADPGTWLLSLFISLIAMLLYIPAMAATFLLEIAGNLLGFVMSTVFNEHLYMDAPFVQIAWGFCRDFANLFFILWLVIIALATIFDVRDYQAKRLLVRLIAVALLVNFSLVLCGFMIDIAQGTMGFLTQSVIRINPGQNGEPGQTFSIAEGLTLAFRQNKLSGVSFWDQVRGLLGGDIEASLRWCLQNVMILLFSAMGAYAFVLMSVMLLIRVVALWVLLILAPLAWIFGIMPFAKKAFSEWMRNFWSWCFYGVVMAFFLYLAAMAVWAIGQAEQFKQAFSGSDALMGSIGGNNTFFKSFSDILSYLIVIIMLYIGVHQGKKSSNSVGNMVTGAVMKYGGNAFKGKTKWTGAPSRWVQGKVRNAKDEAKGRIGGVLMNVPVLRKTGAKMRIESKKAQEKRRGEYRDYSVLSKEDRALLAQRAKGDELVALTKIMMDKGEIYNLNKGETRDAAVLANMHDAIKRSGDEELLKSFESKRIDMLNVDDLKNPDEADISEEEKKARLNARETVKRAVRSGEFKNWNKEFADNLSSETISALAQDKDAAKAIGRAAEDWTKDIKDSVLARVQLGFSNEFREKDENDETIAEGERNVKLRNLYAKMSGKYHEAYFTGTDMGNVEARNRVIESMEKMEQSDWVKIDANEDNYRALALGMNASQTGSAGRVLTVEKKKGMVRALQNIIQNPDDYDPTIVARARATLKKMKKSDVWTDTGLREINLEDDTNNTENELGTDVDEGGEEEGDEGETGEEEAPTPQRPLTGGTPRRGGGTAEQDEETINRGERRGQTTTSGQTSEAGVQADGGPTRIQADQVIIETQNPPKVNAPYIDAEYTKEPVSSTATGQQAPPEKPIILTPEPRGNIKFDQGTGYTPQQRKDFEEMRSRKYEEAMQRKTVLGTDKTLRPEDIGAKGAAAVAGEAEARSRDLRSDAIAQAKQGDFVGALKIADLIGDPEKQDYAFWEIASLQADKEGDFGRAIGTARLIKDPKIRQLALNDIEKMREDKEKKDDDNPPPPPPPPDDSGGDDGGGSLGGADSLSTSELSSDSGKPVADRDINQDQEQIQKDNDNPPPPPQKRPKSIFDQPIWLPKPKPPKPPTPPKEKKDDDDDNPPPPPPDDNPPPRTPPIGVPVQVFKGDEDIFKSRLQRARDKFNQAMDLARKGDFKGARSLALDINDAMIQGRALEHIADLEDRARQDRLNDDDALMRYHSETQDRDTGGSGLRV